MKTEKNFALFFVSNQKWFTFKIQTVGIDTVMTKGTHSWCPRVDVLKCHLKAHMFQIEKSCPPKSHFRVLFSCFGFAVFEGDFLAVHSNVINKAVTNHDT